MRLTALPTPLVLHIHWIFYFYFFVIVHYFLWYKWEGLFINRGIAERVSCHCYYLLIEAASNETSKPYALPPTISFSDSSAETHLCLHKGEHSISVEINYTLNHTPTISFFSLFLFLVVVVMVAAWYFNILNLLFLCI